MLSPTNRAINMTTEEALIVLLEGNALHEFSVHGKNIYKELSPNMKGAHYYVLNFFVNGDEYAPGKYATKAGIVITKCIS